MKLMISAIILLLALNSFSHEGQLFTKSWTMIAGVKVQNLQKGLKRLSQMDLDIAGISYDNKIIDVLINERDYNRLQKLGFDIDVVNTKGVSASPDEEYKTPSEIQELLENFNAKYPQITKLVSIGKSLEGRDIWAIKITQDAHLDDDSKPVVLFNSMHHAREIMTPEISIDIIEYLLEGSKSSLQVNKWLATTVIWVMPMFNVDGNNKMWTEDKYWRKNTRNGYGVDLNRNYPSGWGSCNGSSGSMSSQTYRGDAPASEPETQAMMNFIENIRPVFDISYHSYSEIVIYPYGCADRRVQTKEVVEKLLYNADGGDIDWMYDAYQVIPFVLEVNSRWAGFHPDYGRWRDKTVLRNRVGWQYLIKRAHQSGIRGVVKSNGIVMSDFKVKVYKKAEFKRRSFFQDYNGQKNGVFHIVLNPGQYELEIISNNKVLKTIETNVKEILERVNILL